MHKEDDVDEAMTLGTWDKVSLLEGWRIIRSSLGTWVIVSLLGGWRLMCLSPSGLGLKSTVETAVSVSHWSGGTGTTTRRRREERRERTFLKFYFGHTGYF